MTMSYDTAWLELCKKELETKTGWPPSDQWRDFEFTELGERIFDATGTRLSVTTLKRVFGKVKYDSLPSSATLNALAQYLGYENWMQFKTSHEKETETPAAAAAPSPAEARAPRKVKRRFVAIAAAVLLAALVISGFVFRKTPAAGDSPAAHQISFRSKPLAQGLPNSVVFNINWDGFTTPNALIQQSWDSTKTVRLQPGQAEATGIYYVPGYFRAKLIVDKKIIREHDLFIRSDNWMATIDNNPDPPTYVKPEELILNNGMTVAEPVIKKISTIERPTYLTYHLVRPFAGLQSDNFSFETNFKNIYSEGPAVCKTTKVFILCSSGAFIIPFTIPGCIGSVNLKLGDQTWEGKSNDLSAFGIDPAAGIQLKVEVKNRAVNIYCNNKLVWNGSYHSDAGKVVGLRYSFLGAGTVQHTTLRNEKGEAVYDADFQ